MSNHPTPDNEKPTGGVHIGDVEGGIHNSIIAERVYIQATETDAPLTPDQRQEIERLYLQHIAEECRYLETEGVDQKHPELTYVFVMLEAVEENHRPEMRADVAPLPERTEEMGLKGQVAAFFGRRKPDQKIEREELFPPSPSVPLSQALEDHEHLVILGEPGTGKTTMLQFMALCFATQGWAKARLDLDETRVPVRVDLRAYDGTERLDRFLTQRLDHAYVPEALAQRWLEKGRLAILLDGLDEVPEAQRRAVSQAIERFAATPAGQRCRIAVTSRIAGYRTSRLLGDDFGQYTIRPFAGPEDAQPYMRGWLRALKPQANDDEATEIPEAMEEQGELRRALSNPLLLRLAVAIYVETGETVHTRAELYRRYVEEVMWKRAEKREQARWGYSQIVKALEIIAWGLQTKGRQTEVALVQAVEKGESGATDGRRLLRYLRERLGLLAVYGYEKGELIAFRHLTFQEYFVAQRLERAWRENPSRAWRFLRPRLHHPAWREPILLLRSLLEERATDLARHILEACSPYERDLHRDLLLAAGFVGDGEGVSANVTNEIADRLTQLYLDKKIKWWHPFILPIGLWLLLMTLLYHYGSSLGCLIPLISLIWWGMWWLLPTRRIFPRLQSILSLPHRLSGRGFFSSFQTQIRYELIKAKIRTIKSFVRMLKEGGKLPNDVADALVKFGGHQAVPFLIQILSSEKKQVRSSASELLGRIGDCRAVGHLIHALEDEDKTVRKAAAKALGKMGDALAVPFLIQTLGDEYKSVSKTAIKALGKIGDQIAVEPILQTLEHSWGNLVAIEALGRIGDPRAVKPLIQKLENINCTLSQITDVMKQKGLIQRMVSLIHIVKIVWESEPIVKALGEIGDPGAVPLLIQILEKEWDELGARAAAEALGKIGDSRAVAPLIKALESDNELMRGAAAEALGEIGDSDAIEPLTQALDNKWPVQAKVRKALEMIGEPAAENITQSLAYGKSSVRVSAQRTLEGIGNTTVPYLVQTLEYGEERGRWKSAETLGTIGDPRAIRPLIHALDDEAGRVRKSAAKALGEIGSRQAVEPLIQALENWSLRGKAAEALGAIGDPRAVEPLIWVLKDGGRSAYRALDEFLEKEDQSFTTPLLRSLAPFAQKLKDGNIWGQVAAAKALGAIGDPRAVEPLIGRLKDGKIAVRRARKSLLKIGEPVREPVLRALGSMWGQGAMAKALGEIGDPRSVGPLIRLLDNFWVRQAAAEALGKIGDPRAVKPLSKILNNLWGRRVAIEALETLGENIKDRRVARKVARQLWWRLTDVDDVANVAWDALSVVVARMTKLDVEALDGGPPLFHSKE